MRVLFNTIALEPNRWTKEKRPAHDLGDVLLPRIAEAGFTKIEVWPFHILHKSLDELKKLREQAEKRGLSFLVLGAYPEFHHSGANDEAPRAQRHEILERARVLGAPWVKYFFGRVAGSALTPEQWAATEANFSAWILDGRRQGLNFCAELHNNTLFDPYETGAKQVNLHPGWDVKFCFQPYDFKSTAKNLALIGKLGSKIVHAHFQGRNADGYSRLADSDLDYSKLVPALTMANPEIMHSVEFVKNGFPKEGEALDFDKALADAVADAQFIERYLLSERPDSVRRKRVKS